MIGVWYSITGIEMGMTNQEYKYFLRTHHFSTKIERTNLVALSFLERYMQNLDAHIFLYHVVLYCYFKDLSYFLSSQEKKFFLL